MIAAAAVTTPASVFAQSLAMRDLSVDDYKSVVRNFSANLSHTSVSAASGMGGLLGLQLGFITGRTLTPDINNRVQELDPSAKRSYLPHMTVLGVLSLPLGFSVESTFLPKIGTSDFKYNSFSLAAKWAPTDLFEGSPLHLSAKAHAQKSVVEYDYDVSGVRTAHKYDSMVTGVAGYIGYDVAPMIEPYLGFGLVTGTGDLKVNGSPNVFSDPTFQANQKASATVSSPVYLFGVEFKMGTIRLGFEYSRQFNVDRYTGKFALVPF